MHLLDQLFMYARFSLGLRPFLKESITVETSRQLIQHRFNNRSKNLLTIVRKAIYDNPSSPYLPLLKLAGCTYADFKHMVLRDGIEATLEQLKDSGVYLTCDEFKGKVDVVRSGKIFRFKQHDFDNPLLSRHFEASTSASRSAGTRTIYDFDFLGASWAVYLSQMMAGIDVFDLPLGMWFPIMPGAGPVALLSYLKSGKMPSKWFSPVHNHKFKPSLKSRLGTGYIVYVSNLLKPGLPRPEYVAVDNSSLVAHWIAAMVREKGGCWLTTYTSLAVLICQQAKKHGINISGAKFIANGEPLTEAKRREVESAGASVYPIYGTMETGAIALGCFESCKTDRYHVLNDATTLIQHSRSVPHACSSVDAFLVTNLLKEAPKIMLNVETGDHGRLRNFNCRCRLSMPESVQSISHIRSFEKLTGAGMSFIGTDILRIIEEVLPSRFGGNSTDYQMVEEEDNNGKTRLSIYIHPDVGHVEEKDVVKTVLEMLSKGADNKRLMSEMWQQTNTLNVKKGKPFFSIRGNCCHYISTNTPETIFPPFHCEIYLFN